MKLVLQRFRLRGGAGEPLNCAVRPFLIFRKRVDRQHPGTEMRSNRYAFWHDRIFDSALDVRSKREVVIIHGHRSEAIAKSSGDFIPARGGRAGWRHLFNIDEVGVEGERFDAFRRGEGGLEFVIYEMAVAAEAREEGLEI